MEKVRSTLEMTTAFCLLWPVYMPQKTSATQRRTRMHHSIVGDQLLVQTTNFIVKR